MKIDKILEVIEGNKLQQLRKDCPAMVHNFASPGRKAGDDTPSQHYAILNRRNRLSPGNPC
jgi:hypothetical protein